MAVFQSSLAKRRSGPSHTAFSLLCDGSQQLGNVTAVFIPDDKYVDAYVGSNNEAMSFSLQEDLDNQLLFSQYECTTYMDCGDMNVVCPHCCAHLWFNERAAKKSTIRNAQFSLCCMKGDVKIPYLRKPHELIWNLYNGLDERSSHFIDNIRLYNSMFSFTSLGGKVESSVNDGGGPPQFVISGQNYQQIGSLLPGEGQSPKFAQLYIYDTNNELNNRLSTFRSNDGRFQLDPLLSAQLLHCIDEHNVLAKSFRLVRDFANGNPLTVFHVRLVRHRSNDPRTYNFPVANEVAALIVGDFDGQNSVRDIVVCSYDGFLKRIHETHPLYMPLQYPILFIFGEDGFSEHIPRSFIPHGQDLLAGERVTLREYTAFRIEHREIEFSVLLRSGRLFQQFVVDCYSMVEPQRLSYICEHQPEIRSEFLAGLAEAVDRGDTQATSVGKRVILPASFTGGKRYMFNNCQDAMAICKSRGYPHLFLTFTCNTRWPEIDRYMVRHNIKVADRPDIMCRIFKIKLDLMMDDFKKGLIFGPLIAGMYTIEFQKRGLPHAHILLWLSPESVANEIDFIDSIISAEIPDPNVFPRLYKVVTSFMIHGPCGHVRRQSPCMKGGRCSKFFPKFFSPFSYIDDAGYPIYKRRDTDITVQRHGIILDNRYVVPYSPLLLMKYLAHINIEFCNQSNAIKYLFKYVSKGPDRVTVAFDTVANESNGNQSLGDENVVVDEIKQYYDCRYLSPCESVWRIFKFDIHKRWPAVQRLSFHLPGQQLIYFGDGEHIETVVSRSQRRKTMFTAWMEANEIYVEGRSLTYSEFPSKFVFCANSRKWYPRQSGTSIGRLTFIPPGGGDLYYLRLLLNVQRGCTSFSSLKTVDGVIYQSFEQACSALGLLANDKEFVDGIREAYLIASGMYLRKLFVMLLISNSISKPLFVWEETASLLADDMYRSYRARSSDGSTVPVSVAYDACLPEIEKLLASNGKSLKDFPGMPIPCPLQQLMVANVYIQSELNYDAGLMKSLHEECFNKLNHDQLAAYDRIVSSVNGRNGGFFFVYGYGGTGKTFLWNTLSYRFRAEKKIVLNVASSGIASLLLPGGRTAHSLFAIPLNLNEDSCCNIKQGSLKAELLKAASLIIWDEAPMMHRWAFEAFDRTMRDIMRDVSTDCSNIPFGGKTVVLGGDFRQILSVLPRGYRASIVMSTITSSYLWRFCTVLRLNQNMRLFCCPTSSSSNELSAFAKWVLDLGDGKLGHDVDGESDVVIPPCFCLPFSSDPIRTIVMSTYPNLIENLGNFRYFEERAILAPRLDAVESINSYVLSLIPGEVKEYLSSDYICSADEDVGLNVDWVTPEFLNKIKLSGFPNHSLLLKVGSPIILLRNIDQAIGLCNGTRLIILELGKNIIVARVITGSSAGEKVLIPRMNLISSDSNMPINFCRRQFPISLCFSMSINKSQGQTPKHVGLYLSKPVFTHGQLYVAISRINSPAGLKILVCCDESNSSYVTRNVVYKEIFRMI